VITRAKWITTIAIIVLTVSLAALSAQDKHSLEARYKHKFVVVQKEGLAVGVCAQQPADLEHVPRPILEELVENGIVTSKKAAPTGCPLGSSEAIHVGEVMSVEFQGVGRVLGEGHLCSIGVVPQTRIDLTDKVLYKYANMTIEFQDGKVVDVRYF
jgi:hypothetical protein